MSDGSHRDISLERRGRLRRAEPKKDKPEGWRDVDETGSTLGLHALVVAATMFGRPFARLIVAFVAFYYSIVSRRSRESVGAFRRRLGLRVGFFASYRHILRFSQCALDALFFMRGRTDLFRVTRVGHHHLEELRVSRRGAILLGAHLGSFYAMRAASAEKSLPLNPVVYTKNARKFNAVIESLDPSSTTRLIEIGEGGQIDFMLKIRDRLEGGALVAILGDRVQPEGRCATVDFLGGKAKLPLGPYLLAASLRRPVYFTAGVFRGGNHYELHCIPFADRIVLPRGRREEAMAEYAQRYADMLADFCRKYPENWFNFYDFFEE